MKDIITFRVVLNKVFMLYVALNLNGKREKDEEKANSYPEGRKDFVSSQADELISLVINTF